MRRAVEHLRSVCALAVLTLAVCGCTHQLVSPATAHEQRLEVTRLAAARGDLAAARSAYREMLAQYGDDPRLADERAQTLRHLARVEHQAGNYAAAESFLLQALDLVERYHGKDDARVGWVASELGPVYQSTTRLAEAEYFHRRALELLEPVLDADDVHLSILLNNLGSVLVAQDRHEEAVALLERARGQSTAGDDGYPRALVLINLADTYRQMGRLQDAEQAYRSALASQRVELGYRANLIAMSCLDGLAEIEADRGELETAGTLLRAAIGVGERILEAGESYRPGMSLYEHTQQQLERLNGRYLEIRALLAGGWV